MILSLNLQANFQKQIQLTEWEGERGLLLRKHVVFLLHFDMVDSSGLTLNDIKNALIINEHTSLSHDANRSRE